MPKGPKQPGSQKKGSKQQGSTQSANKKRPRAPRCNLCGSRIHVPHEWSKGAATRRHYWRKHPEVMRKDRG